MTSLSPLLLSQRRSAYRTLLRSASLAFHGDRGVLLAFRAKVRDDFETDHSLGDEARCKAQLAHALEVANILRHNLAQGENNGKDDVWKLKWREDLELGDNSSIKKHKKTKTVQTDQGTVAYSKLKPPGNSESQERQRMFPSLRSLLKAHKKREVPLIKQEDIEETFIRGSGPGGQAINKTKSNVSLFHKPSGIRVTCQYSRSLEHNRKIARRILKERLDQIANPGLSKEQVRWAKERERKRQRARKAEKKLAKKLADKGGEKNISE